MSPVEPLHAGFLRSAERFADRPALEVGGAALTYAELDRSARAIAATLLAATPAGGPPLTAVCAARSATAYAGLLGALMRGHGYVPLNPRFPVDRSRVMFERAGCRAVVADEASLEHLDGIVAAAPDPLLIVLPDRDDVSAAAARWPAHSVLGARDLGDPDAFSPAGRTEPGQIAYLLFTSGSTGLPKGVMVAHENARAFVASEVERYAIAETDRFSQTFDLTFDLSVFDLFVAWERGACVCVPGATQLMRPGPWIREAELTVWFSVPSLGLFMRRLGMVKPGSYPTLRWSLFCGEPLPASLAADWAAAAPASTVENLYGPTELTIACTQHRWDPATSPALCVHDLVPIGEPFRGMTPFVAGPDLQEVAPGQEGELLMTGPQVTLGYWRDEERTAVAFVVPPGRDTLHYRTGDLVRRPEGGAALVFLGRVDSQVKISGYRVEMAEVEQALRAAAGTEEAVAVPWPRTESSATGITAFVQAEEVDAGAIKRAMGERLPPYMVPRAVRAIAELPLNVNGKFDRKALVALLESGD
jgi:amino acid adenylation domain-containing protein